MIKRFILILFVFVFAFVFVSCSKSSSKIIGNNAKTNLSDNKDDSKPLSPVIIQSEVGENADTPKTNENTELTEQNEAGKDLTEQSTVTPDPTEEIITNATPYYARLGTYNEFMYFLNWFKTKDYTIVCFNLDKSSFFGRGEYSFDGFPILFDKGTINDIVYDVTDEFFFEQPMHFYFSYQFYSMNDCFYTYGFDTEGTGNHFKISCFHPPVRTEFDENGEISFEKVENDKINEYKMFVGNTEVMDIKIQLGKYTDPSILEEILENLKEIVTFIK